VYGFQVGDDDGCHCGFDALKIAGQAHRFGEHDNAFGVLRLVLASLVIVAHTPEMIDGSRRREPLSLLFGSGSVSLGDLAVNGFFVISGYLITASALQSRSWGSYLTKRVCRIYPAFVFASLLCVAIAPLVGGEGLLASGASMVRAIKNILLLREPQAPGAFEGHAFVEMNKAVWTISYEFRCYLLVMLIATCGLLRRPLVLAAGSAIAVMLGDFLPDAWRTMLADLPLSGIWLGEPGAFLRLSGMFLAGAAFYGWRRAIPLHAGLVVAAVAALIAALASHRMVDLACAVAGAYLIFAAAAAGARTPLRHVNDRDDISYGLYLYGWPIEQFLIFYLGVPSFALLGGMTWLLAACAGALSWLLLEKPIMRLVRSSRPDRSSPAMVDGRSAEPAARSAS
jgi:peptidoglycan/LPS O-acetylase OafA/YrhL